MNKNFKRFLFFYLAIVALLCGFIGFFSATPSSADAVVTPPVASPTAVIIDQTTTTRADMFEIADRYMRYRWVAVNDHPFNHTDMPKNDLHDSYYDINAPDRPHVDTPDKQWCDSHIGVDLGDVFQFRLVSSWGCWDYAPAINVGVPYYWGGKNAIRNNDPYNNDKPDLHLAPIDGRGISGSEYFDQRITAGRAAGDVVVENDYRIHGRGSLDITGVDCTGLVMQVWRLDTGFTPSNLVNLSRPILFKNLREGDILFDSAAHAVIFREWENYDPTQGDPVASPNRGDGTIFYAYEAAQDMKKTVLSAYQLYSTAGDLEPSAQYGGYFGIPIGYSTTQPVQIMRLESWSVNPDGSWNKSDQGQGAMVYHAYPRTYFTPIDVELVIDISGSITTQVAKDNAKAIFDFLRPGDKIGIVTFTGGATVLQSLTEITDTNRQMFYDKIDSIQTGGATSIAKGLQVAENDITTHAFNNNDQQPDPVHIMILMSDGEENTAPLMRDQDALLDRVKTKEIPIYTLQTGGSVGTSLLNKIANRTGGYFASSKEELITNFQIKVFTGNVIKTVSSTIGSDTTVGTTSSATTKSFATASDTTDTSSCGGIDEICAAVDSSMGAMTVSLFWSGNVIDLTLERPDTSIIDFTSSGSDPNFSFISGNNFLSYTVKAPQLVVRLKSNST